MTIVRVQAEDFDPGRELEALTRGRVDVGALASFVGLVRDANDGRPIAGMTLEHYPGMTEKALAEICREAHSRWDVLDTLVIHRVGPLVPGDRIVLVGVSSGHRGEAFAACEFIMDYLKTRAPFWKREETPEGPRWVDARASDDSAAERWGQTPISEGEARKRK
jgi:molybdopterin synthase catalytic subunit